MQRPPLIVIGGATATGKTGLSLEIAGAIDGAHIISADSRQVFRGMDVGTAKLPLDERRGIPHHGIDLVDPDERFTVADFTRHVDAVLSGVAREAPAAVLVGGTGLYLRAVGRGLPIDESGHDPAIRAELESRFAEAGLDPLVGELRQRAPHLAAMIDLRNPRRVIRALERLATAGHVRPLTPRGYPAPTLWLGLELDGATHRQWIERRARRQFEAGLLREAETLVGSYPVTLPAFSAIGYREAFSVLAGERSIEDAVKETATRTWEYARRQRTWFRAEAGMTWLNAGDAKATVVAATELVRRFLEGR